MFSYWLKKDKIKLTLRKIYKTDIRELRIIDIDIYIYTYI